MKNKIGLVVVFTLFTILVQAQDFNFKEEYKKVVTLFEGENYDSALPLLEELANHSEGNDNIKFLIGFCYLESHVDKAKAIPYFEDILARDNNLTIGWDYRNHKEKKAPLKIMEYMGEAYHYNYQFDKALASFEEYKEFLGDANVEELREVNKSMRMSKYAKKLMETPVNIEVDNLGKSINSKYADYAPVVSADEHQIYFTTRRKGVKGENLTEDGKYFEDIFYSVIEKNKWTPALNMGDSINTGNHEATMSISADGEQLLMYKYELGSGGIYLSKKAGLEWMSPEKLGSDINTEAWESHANFSADGSLIYFTSDRKGGRGGRDIYFAKKSPTGEWAMSQTEGLELINTPYDEESPFLHPDGKTLYFSSKGHQTMGGFDIFVSVFDDSTGGWGEPENIGYPVNTTGDDVFYIPSTDGKRAYFSSEREGGFGDQDIYVLHFPDVKEKNLTVYKGLVKDFEGDVPENLRIYVSDANSGETLGEYKPNSAEGNYLLVLAAGGDYFIDFKQNDDQNNFQPYRDTISVALDAGFENIYNEIQLKEFGDKTPANIIVQKVNLNELANKDSSEIEESSMRIGNRFNPGKIMMNALHGTVITIPGMNSIGIIQFPVDSQSWFKC